MRCVRIIAGEHRGRQLLAPVGEQTRPVTDRVKQSVFDILSPIVGGASVYDCFAGTGSFGLESLSRGASHATFFESHRPTVELLRRNIRTIRADAHATIVTADWFAAMRAGPSGSLATIVFLDPPYRYLVERPTELQTAAVGLLRHLADDGVVVFRHDAGDRLALHGFDVVDARDYGGMAVEFLRRAIAPGLR